MTEPVAWPTLPSVRVKIHDETATGRVIGALEPDVSWPVRR
ncbi:hypothetical protein OHA72_34105 [Dactylosporangium sp. NBC_01737]|nr:hypothetical protein OHA72_34105 [Dactylosporangium sp. NBC_01737]